MSSPKGGGGSSYGAPQLSMQSNTSTIPAWLTQGSQFATAHAQDMLKTGMPLYQGELTAPMNGYQQQAGQQIVGSQGQYMPYYGQAASAVQRSFAPVQNVTPQTFQNGLTNVQRYMSPYTQQVIDAARAAGAQALDQNLNQIKDSAVTAKAFGGSRDLVQRGAAAEQNALGQQQFDANMLDRAYGNATGLMGQDISNNLAAQGQNQNAALTQQRNLQTGGIALGTVAQNAQQSGLQDINNLLGYGGLVQNTRQAADSANFGYYNQGVNYPIQMQQLLNSTLSSVPHDTSTTSIGTSSTPATSSNGMMSGLGGMMSGASMGGQIASAFPSLGLSSGLGSVLGGGAGALLGILSDENDKTDIEKVGTDPQTGLTLHAYRYKSDAKNTPKIVGPMAQEVEKKYPGTTRKIGGKLVINTNALAGALARRVA